MALHVGLVLLLMSVVAEAHPATRRPLIGRVVDSAGRDTAVAKVQAGRTTRASATGQIRGRVFDEYEASIPDVSVSFQPADPRSGLTPFEAVADARGRFDFAGVRPGTYRVTGKALGYEATVIIQEVAAGVETDVTVVVRRRP